MTFDSAFGLKILCQSNASNSYKLPFDEKFHRKVVWKSLEILFFRSRPALLLMLSQVHQNVAYRIVIRTFEFTVFLLNRRVIFYLKVGNLYVISQKLQKIHWVIFFPECKPAWLANATVMCYYLSTSLCHVIYKYVMPNQNLIPYSYFITDWYKKNTHTMKYSLILLAVIGTTFAEIIFEERFGSGTYLL